MRVTVDVMDPEHFRNVQTEIQNKKLFRQASTGDISPAQIAIEEICTIYYNTNISLYETAIQAQPSETDAQKLLNDNTLNLQNKQRDKLKNITSDEGKNVCLQQDLGFTNFNVTNLYQQFSNLNCNSNECESNQTERFKQNQYNLGRYTKSVNTIRFTAAQNLNQSKNVVLGLVQHNKKKDTEADKEKKTSAQQVIENETQAGQEAVKNVSVTNVNNGYLGADGRTLVLSELAFAAANAPDAAWEKDYNVAKGVGVGGSLDTVIKLNSTADFSVKGLIFDARSTALTARKMTVSTLQLLAAGSGLPIQQIRTAVTDANGNTTQAQGEVIDENTQIITAKTEIETDRQLDIYYRAALKQIAATTISTVDTINKSTAGSKTITDARTANKSAYESNKTFIEALNTEQ